MKDLYGKKEKHDHKFSNLLKECILAIVMLAPFFAILSKIIYVSVNKNAKDSYYGETINDVKINPITNLNIGDEVYFENTNNIDPTTETGTVSNNYITYTDIEIINVGTLSTEAQNLIKTSVKIGFYKVLNNNFYSIFFYQNNNTSNSYSSTVPFTIKFTITNFQFNTLTPFELYNQTPFTTRTYNQYSYLDNVFYYAIDQSKDEEILNWTKDTPIYNVINTMNTGLGLSNNHILTYLLTYWSIILAIYIVFDIIIFVFTKITHYLQ